MLNQLPKLKKIQRALESFFYKIRINIGLYNLLHHPTYKSFSQKVFKALEKQILYFAKVEKVNQIIGLKKSTSGADEEDLAKNLIKMWIPLTALLEEQDFKDYILWAANRGGQIGIGKTNSDSIFELTNPILVGRLQRRLNEAVGQIDTTTQSWIVRTIDQGLQQKLSLIEIAKALRDNGHQVAKERSDLIAEQEAAIALGEIETEFFKRNGIKFQQWRTQRDEAVCIACVANEEAGEVKIGEAFPSGALTTPQHPRCRCIAIPVMPKNIKVTWTGQ